MAKTKQKTGKGMVPAGHNDDQEQAKAMAKGPKVNLPSLPIDPTKDAGAGQENMTSDDLAVPRLQVLQKGSPQVDKTNKAYVKGAEAGMIINTVTGTMFDGEEGIEVCPLAYQRNHIEWKPRAKGGGFIRNHGMSPAILEQCSIDESRNAMLANGNEIVPTAEYFCFMLNEDGSWAPVVISMAKTQMKKARNWNTLISQFQAPRPDGAGVFNPAMFYRCYRLTTMPESNDKGSWFGWHVEPSELTMERKNGTNLYVAARDFRGKVMSGRVAAAPPPQQDGGDSEGDSATV